MFSIIDKVTKSDKTRYSKREVLELLEQYNFIDAPKEIKLSEIVKVFRERYTENNDFKIVIGREDSYTSIRGVTHDYISIVYMHESGLFEKTIAVLESIAGNCFKFVYIEPSKKVLDLMALWINNTGIEIDVKDLKDA